MNEHKAAVAEVVRRRDLGLGSANCFVGLKIDVDFDVLRTLEDGRAPFAYIISAMRLEVVRVRNALVQRRGRG